MTTPNYSSYEDFTAACNNAATTVVQEGRGIVMKGPHLNSPAQATQAAKKLGEAA